MNDLAIAGTAQNFKSAPPERPVDMTRVPLTMPDNLLPPLNLTFWRIGNAQVMFDHDRNISVSTLGIVKLTLDHNAIHRPQGQPLDEPELPFRLNISPKAAFVAMLVAVANLIPVLALPFEENR